MKLIAYKNVTRAMEIRAASHRRQWMDETYHQYAYRCLPLSIANANGWELLAPENILITWNGGRHKEDLQIHYETGSFHFAASSFGEGIVTFHPGYVFRTDSGRSNEKYDLWVSGSPNHWYDFMVPLTGVVESWWLPFTFTMNWKLLKPGTYQVAKGSPICFIMIIPHALPKITAEIHDINSNPELLSDYNAWSKERTETIRKLDVLSKTGQGVDGMDPNNPATQWEKTYMRGEKKDGTKAKDHQTKRRLPEFKEDK